MSRPSLYKAQEFSERFLKSGNAGQNLNRLLRYIRMLKREAKE